MLVNNMGQGMAHLKINYSGTLLAVRLTIKPSGKYLTQNKELSCAACNLTVALP